MNLKQYKKGINRALKSHETHTNKYNLLLSCWNYFSHIQAFLFEQ